MVKDRIDIKKLTMDELAGVVNIYPWYAGAQMELCSRMKAIDALDDDQLARTALHAGSRRMLYDLIHGAPGCLEAGRDNALPEAPSYNRKVFVVGGDYFSQSQYNGVRRNEDNIFSSFATRSKVAPYTEQQVEQHDDFCTETLAQIYLEQGYPAEAKAIYSKLILRYPEKSVYFAALIEKLNENI